MMSLRVVSFVGDSVICGSYLMVAVLLRFVGVAGGWGDVSSASWGRWVGCGDGAAQASAGRRGAFIGIRRG